MCWLQEGYTNIISLFFWSTHPLQMALSRFRFRQAYVVTPPDTSRDAARFSVESGMKPANLRGLFGAHGPPSPPQKIAGLHDRGKGKGRDNGWFLRSRSFKQFFFLEEDFHDVNWTEDFINYNYSEHAWELCNCMRNLRCNEALEHFLRPMHMGKDVCHFFPTESYSVYQNLNQHLTMTIHHCRRRHHPPPPPPHHHHQTLLSQSLLNLSPMRSTSGSFKPCGPKLLEELGRYSARDFPKLRRKEFLATNLHFAHKIFRNLFRFSSFHLGRGISSINKTAKMTFHWRSFFQQLSVQAYLHLQSPRRCLCGAGPLNDGHATEMHGAQAHTTHQGSTARIRWFDLVVSTFVHPQSALNGIFLSAR